MKHIWPFIFMLFIGWSNTFLFAQSEDEYFHKAGYEYYKADYPKAHKIVMNGLEKYNSSEKLNKLNELICEKWTGCEGNIEPPESPCNGNDRDGDGICDEVDPCPDDETNSCQGCESDRDNDGICDDEDYCPDDETNSCGQIGCDSDRDNDGICDEDDACPDNAGIPHPVNNGCPKDSDGDGVWDMYDKCPDKRGSENHSGCPDSDGDGVYDDVDRCDSDPGPSSNNGCPEAPVVVKETINCNIRHIDYDPKVSWNPDLTNKADRIRIRFTLEEGNSQGHTSGWLDTGGNSILFQPGDARFHKKWTTIELDVDIDEVKYKVIGKKITKQKFNCN